MQIRRYVTEGEAYPFGYRFAWFDFPMHRKVAYPLGLNFLMAWGRRIWGWTWKYRPGIPEFDRLRLEADASRRMLEMERFRAHERWLAGFETGCLLGRQDPEAAMQRLTEKRAESARLERVAFPDGG